jgi:membrane-associated phospholipid phosphatase
MLRQQVAKIAANILNPFLLSFILIILLSVESTSSANEAIKWSLISLALSVFPVFTVVLYLVRRRKLDGIFINPRQQRSRIYLLALSCAIIGYIILIIFDAPELLRAAFLSGLIAVTVFMIINLFWKISLHTAFITASVTVLIIVYGEAAAWTAIFIPLIAWARLEMKLHTPAQVFVGTLLSVSIVTIVFYLFGIIGG